MCMQTQERRRWKQYSDTSPCVVLGGWQPYLINLVRAHSSDRLTASITKRGIHVVLLCYAMERSTNHNKGVYAQSNKRTSCNDVCQCHDGDQAVGHAV
jgi:hypothetical protein